MSMKHVGAWATVLLMISATAEPCSISGPVSPEEVVRGADAIVTATAVEYARPPKDPTIWTTGSPDSEVRFLVMEVLKGQVVPSVIGLPGYLVENDDLNELNAPYAFVRPGGRSGSCFANSYRHNGEFLLMLSDKPVVRTPSIGTHLVPSMNSFAVSEIRGCSGFAIRSTSSVSQVGRNEQTRRGARAW